MVGDRTAEPARHWGPHARAAHRYRITRLQPTWSACACPPSSPKKKSEKLKPAGTQEQGGIYRVSFILRLLLFAERYRSLFTLLTHQRYIGTWEELTIFFTDCFGDFYRWFKSVRENLRRRFQGKIFLVLVKRKIVFFCLLQNKIQLLFHNKNYEFNLIKKLRVIVGYCKECFVTFTDCFYSDFTQKIWSFGGIERMIASGLFRK